MNEDVVVNEGLWGPFHPDLRAARWLPRFGVGPRTLRLWRFTLPARPSTPEVSARTVDLSSGGGAQNARVFEPVGVTGPLPTVFWIHGGGLVSGTPMVDDRTNMALARDLGATVIAPSYRLAPEHPAPAALDDVYSAFRTVLNRAEEFGVDPERVAIAGASAGGGLAAGLVNRLQDEHDPRPVFQLLVYPMLDDRTTLRTDQNSPRLRVWTPRANQFGWRSYLGQEPGGPTISHRLVPARRHDLTGLPPTWIGVGSLDLFHDEAVEYARRLQEADVPCELEVVGGAFHGFDAMFPKSGVSRAFYASWLRALRAAFRAN